MTVQQAGQEGLIIRDNDPELGRGTRTETQIKLMYASGYRFNPDDQSWHRLFVGEAGAPFMPWKTAEWGVGAPKKKRGFFRRK